MAKFKAHLYETEHSGFYDNNDVKHIPYFLPSAWTTFTPEQITTATFNMVPKTWTKFTVTDGDWMTKNTIIPLSSRDLYLADLLDNLAPKLHTFVDGKHTSITTDARGLKYINQYYNAEDFTDEFTCPQGTIDITFSEDKKCAFLKIKDGIHDLSNDSTCQNWYFTDTNGGLWSNYLSADKAQFVSLSSQQSVNTNLSGVNFNVNTLTGGTITSTRTSATNLYGNDFITPNDFKVSDDFSAMTADFSGAGDANKSLCLNGSAYNLSASQDFKIQSTFALSYLTANRTVATSVYAPDSELNSACLSSIKNNNLYATGMNVANLLTANKMNFMQYSYTNTALMLTAENIKSTGNITANICDVEGVYSELREKPFVVNGDFEVYAAKKPAQKTSLSGILSNYSQMSHKECLCVVKAGTFNIERSGIKYNQPANTITYYTDGDDQSGISQSLNLASFQNQISNYQKKYKINKWIFELGNLKTKNELIIPVNLLDLQDYIEYDYTLIPSYYGYNGDGSVGEWDDHYSLRVAYKFVADTTVPCNYYFYTAPYSIESKNGKCFPVAPRSKSTTTNENDVIMNYFIENVQNQAVFYVPLVIRTGTISNLWWSYSQMYDYTGSRVYEFSTQINTRFNVLCDAQYGADGKVKSYNCYIYFLNGMNY